MNQISSQLKQELSKSLVHSNSKRAIEILDKTKLDVNTIVTLKTNETLLFKAITPLTEYYGSESQIEIIKYLIEHGADLNLKNNHGYSPLHISISHHGLSKIALMLLDNKSIDVESESKNGTNLIVVAIREYGLVWRPEQQETQKLRFKIIEKLLENNANLDKRNTYNVCARDWIERCEDERLNQLIEDYDKRKKTNDNTA